MGLEIEKSPRTAFSRIVSMGRSTIFSPIGSHRLKWPNWSVRTISLPSQAPDLKQWYKERGSGVKKTIPGKQIIEISERQTNEHILNL